MSNKLLDPQGVAEKFAVTPQQIIDYLTLMGDKVDNVPGIDKVGPKTAAKWMAEYDSLEQVIQHADEIRGKVGENLRASLSYLPRSKQLITIKTDVNLGVNISDLTCKPPDNLILKPLYTELEFRSWLAEILNQA